MHRIHYDFCAEPIDPNKGANRPGHLPHIVARNKAQTAHSSHRRNARGRQPGGLLGPAPVDIVPCDVEVARLPDVPHGIEIEDIGPEELVLVVDIAVDASVPGNLYLQEFRSAELRSAPRTHGGIGFRGRHTSMIVAEIVMHLARHVIEAGQLFDQGGDVALPPP